MHVEEEIYYQTHINIELMFDRWKKMKEMVFSNRN